MDGFISYPRTDNTVYPPSLPLRELVASLVRIPEFSAAAGLLDGRADADPRQEGDHRPPADLPDPGASTRTRSTAPNRRVYELVARRFLATFSRADDHRVDPGRHRGRRRRPTSSAARSSSTPATPAIYTYARSADDEIPALEEGQELDARRRPVDRRQGDPAAVADQPGQAARDDGGARPRHQGDARRTSSRSSYDRGYVYNNPPGPVGHRNRDVRGVQAVTCPGWRRRRSPAEFERGHGPDRRRKERPRDEVVQRSAARCFIRPPTDVQEKTKTRTWPR